MFKIVWTLLACVVAATPLYASSGKDLAKQPTCVISEEAPCSFINDTVNVVGGSFHLQLPHLQVPGHVPLDLIQYYNSQSDYTSWVGVGMSLNYSFAISATLYADKKYDKYGKYNETHAESPGGSIIRCLGKFDAYNKADYYLDPDVIHEGFTNCGSGNISARSNLKNVRITQNTKYASYSDWKCYLPDGSVRDYYRVFDLPITHVFSEKRPNKTSLEFDYHWYTEVNPGYKVKRVDSIKKIKAKAKHEMNWLAFSTHSKSAKIHASNGKWAHFRGFNKDGNFYINEIESSDGPKQKFSYKHAGKRFSINQVEWPDGRFLEVDYDHKGRVISQKAPVGNNDEKRTIWKFTYHDKKTKVLDAYDNKKIYNHKYDRITSIDEYKNNDLYRARTFYWGQKEGHSWGKHTKSQEGNLLGSSLLNNEQCGVFLANYTYDEYGNVLKETTFGNLSGTYPYPFWINDDATPKDPNLESYSKYYSYSKELHLMTHQSEDCGPSIEYRYKPGTDLMWAKFVLDGDKVIQREFYEYNDDGILIEKIVDDGDCDNKSWLSGVTERRITEIVPVSGKEGYGQGLAQGVWEKYLNLVTDEVVLLKHTHYNYNKAGQVTEEAIFDANNDYCHSTWYEYDNKGRLTKTTNPIGQTFVYGYDNNNNKTYEKQEDAGYYTLYEYDKANRLTAVIEHHDDETAVHHHYEYDLMGNKTASVDRYGNKTSYEYDQCNRLVTITLPTAPDGALYTIKKEYDIFDNVIKETNQNGISTTYTYAAKKKPTLVTYADGSQEQHVYNLNGTLAYMVDKGGAKTCYRYDLLGRVIETSIYDSLSNKLSSSSSIYNAFHQLCSTDAMGYTTHYSYDAAGRKIEELKKAGDNYSKTTFEYDTLGRPVATKRFYGQEATSYVTTFVEYDTLDRVILEKYLNMAGDCTGWTYYEYNVQGMCTLQRSGHTHEDADIKTRYNSQREVIEQQDEYANKTLIHTDHNFINSQDRKVVRKITTDPLCNLTEECYDPLGRVVSVVKKNSQQQILAATDFTYSATNQKTKQVEHVVIDGEIDHDYTITWQYDALGRLITLIEEPGGPDEKTSCYTYDISGKILTITKPNGVVLNHSYDALGRLIGLYSSDGTVGYIYFYDLNNNPIEVVDSVQGYSSVYSYDGWSRTLSDGIKNTFSQSFVYDALGRITSLMAPDGSLVGYSYKEGNLDTITWKGAMHRYKEFDLKNRPLRATLIGKAGEHSLVWDKKGRIVKIATPHFTQTISDDGFDAVGNLKGCNFTDGVGQVEIAAAYDDLYQLTQEVGVQTHSYTNDSLANRQSKNNDLYSVDSKNKLLNTKENAFTYDKNGNLIQQVTPKHTMRFAYDALDRLIKVSDGKQEIAYCYDNFHRRISCSANGKAPEYFLHLGQREIGLYNPTTKKLKEYRVLGLGKGAELGASVVIELDGKLFSPIHDHRGSVVALIDADTGEIAESYRYTAFGECETYSHSQHQIEKTAVHNPWGYASKRLDSETGFVYFSRRYYAPATGRWITPDPLGFADGPNMYAYVQNNPMTRFDLYGLYVEEGYNPANWKPYECKNSQVSAAYDRRIEATYRDAGYKIHGTLFGKNQKNYNSIALEGRPKYSGGNLVYVPGMNTSFASSIKQAMYISDLCGGHNVDVIQNFSYTLFGDIPRAALEKFGGMSTEAVKDLDAYLRQSTNKNFITCFSEGAIITDNAFKSVGSDIASNSYAVAVCPGKLVPKSPAGDAVNVVNRNIYRDPIPHLDCLFGLAGFLHRNESGCNVIYKESHQSADRFDHDVISLTYKDEIKEEFSRFEALKGVK